jgi:hypothetical protein
MNLSFSDIDKKAHADKVNSYIIYKTIKLAKAGKSANKAFAIACEDENFYGTRADIVAHRRRAAAHLYKYYKIKISPKAIADIEQFL